MPGSYRETAGDGCGGDGALFELDHVWVRAEDPESAIEELGALGFVPGGGEAHAGLGTANAVFFFDDAYLELLWAVDPERLRAPDVARTHLAERLQVGGSASPFGVSFRFAADAPPGSALPIPTWPWPLPFLPAAAVPMPVATTSDRLQEPIVFASLVTSRPDARRVTRQEALGVQEVTDLAVDVAGSEPSEVLAALEQLGIARFKQVSSAPRAVLTLDGQRQGRTAVLTQLPLTLRW